ncbi:unnamed protein product [Closterium sp. NIES-54]
MEGLPAFEWPEAASFPQLLVTGDPVHAGATDDIIGIPDAVLKEKSTEALQLMWTTPPTKDLHTDHGTKLKDTNITRRQLATEQTQKSGINDSDIPFTHPNFDTGDIGGADSGGVGSGDAASPTGGGGAGGAAAGGSAGGGAGGAGAGGAGAVGAGAGGAGARSRGTGPGGASTGVPGVGRAGGTGAGGTGTIGGTGGAATVGAAAGSPDSRRQESLSPERLREWSVRWGSPGGGAGRAGAAGSGGAGPGGASAGVPGVGRGGGTGAGGTGTTGGTGGAADVDAAAGSPGSRCQESLSPERLREWAVHWGSPGGGARRARAAGSGGAGPGGASAGVPRVGRAGGTGTGGTGATGGTGGAGPVGANAVVPGAGDTGSVDTGGATGGTGVGGTRRQESLSPQQLREWAVRWGSPSGGAGGAGSGGAVPTGARGSWGVTTQPQLSALRHLLSLPPATTEFPVAGTTPPLLFPPTVQSQPQLQLRTPLPHIAVTDSFTQRRESASCPVMPVRSRRAVRPRPPPVPSTHIMAHRPSSVPKRVVLPSPPASSLPHVLEPEPDLVRTATLTVTRLLATVVTDPSFGFAVASALVAELVDFAALCRLDYAASLVFYSSCPPSVGGELAHGCDVLEDMQFELVCLAATAPHLASTLLCPEGEPDALDISTPHTYAEAITGPYSSKRQIPMEAEMASWKSTGTYVNEVPPPWANIVDGMWIFWVKRPPGSPPAFKTRYVARGFSQREGVDFFQTFSPTPKMTTLRVLLHVIAQRDYKLHSLDFSTAFLQGNLHEAIWLRRSHGFTGSLPEALGFAPSSADPSLFLRTDTSLSPFYVLVYVDDLVFATSDTDALTLVKAELQESTPALTWVLQRLDFSWSSPQPTPLSTGHSFLAPPLDESVEPSGPYPELVGCLMYLMTCIRPDLAYPLSLLARYVAPGRHRKVHWETAKRVLRYLCSTSGMGLVLGGWGSVVLTGHSDAPWADDQTTHRSTQGYSFSLGTGFVSWRSTRSSSVLSSNCEAEIYNGAMAAQELCWLTYLLTDLGERSRSPPILYVDNKAMIALCQDQRLEHRT